MDKQNFFDTLRDIPIHNYLGEGDILDAMGNFSHRKFFNWRILDFCLRNKVDIESWVDTSTKTPNEKQIIGLENRNQEEKEPIGEGGLVSDAQKQGNFKSVLSNQEKDVEEDYDKSDKKKQLDFFLKRLINPNEIVISSIQRGEMNLDILMIQKDLTLRELMKKGILIIDPVRLSVKNDGQFILYQTIILTKNKHLDSDKKKLIKLKFFLWPNYRLEDLACMNRYWFNTNNGSRFSMIRIRMYPRLKIR
ncbi:hypothetical protein ERO13_1Z049494v2 [Gossypium hirsutum]|nr:hypothetical protein ERO13_1Z049494v2 [Gossypium hirsutum]